MMTDEAQGAKSCPIGTPVERVRSPRSSCQPHRLRPIGLAVVGQVGGQQVGGTVYMPRFARAKRGFLNGGDTPGIRDWPKYPSRQLYHLRTSIVCSWRRKLFGIPPTAPSKRRRTVSAWGIVAACVPRQGTHPLCWLFRYLIGCPALTRARTGGFRTSMPKQAGRDY